MKVIVAGLPKTGTKSMKAALTQLGYKVYDSPENIYYLQGEYAKIIKEGWTTDDFRKMYEGVDAVMDIPACVFWDEILRAYPDSKVVLTIRENEEIWFKSLLCQFKSQSRLSYYLLGLLTSTGRTIKKTITDPILLLMFGFSSPSLFSPRFQLNADFAKKSYRAHNAYVMHATPKEQLLVFKCTDGWNPLCKFLGVPAPDGPFPHRNRNGNFKPEIEQTSMYKQAEKEIKRSLALLATVTSTSLFLSYQYGAANLICSAYDELIHFVHDVSFW